MRRELIYIYVTARSLISLIQCHVYEVCTLIVDQINADIMRFINIRWCFSYPDAGNIILSLYGGQGHVWSLPHHHQRHTGRTAAPAALSVSSLAPGFVGWAWPPHSAGPDALGQSQTCNDTPCYEQSTNLIVYAWWQLFTLHCHITWKKRDTTFKYMWHRHQTWRDSYLFVHYKAKVSCLSL